MLGGAFQPIPAPEAAAAAAAAAMAESSDSESENAPQGNVNRPNFRTGALNHASLETALSKLTSDEIALTHRFNEGHLRLEKLVHDYRNKIIGQKAFVVHWSVSFHP